MPSEAEYARILARTYDSVHEPPKAEILVGRMESIDLGSRGPPELQGVAESSKETVVVARV